MTKKKLSKEAQSIESFEKIHKDCNLFMDDGSLTPDGWDFLKFAENNWGEDPKWHDHEKFHTRSRISEYWYGEGEEADIIYWDFWNELHPTGKMKI